MASYDPEFYEAPKSPPGYGEPQPRQRGCFFYGCVFASVFSLLLIVGLGVLTYLGVRVAYRFIDEWTSTAPMELPKVQITEDQRKSVKDRVDTFRDALEKGKAVEPLILTGDDLNALIEDSADFRGKIHARVEGDKLKAKISFPLDKLGLAPFRGRYLNGEAELKASLNNGVLIVTLNSLEVNGKRPPDAFLAQLRQQNLAQDAYKNPRNAEMISRFESLEIKDGTMILKPRQSGKSPAEKSESQSSGGPSSPSPEDAPHAEAPAPAPTPR
jgi:hypothetical protein